MKLFSFILSTCCCLSLATTAQEATLPQNAIFIDSDSFMPKLLTASADYEKAGTTLSSEKAREQLKFTVDQKVSFTFEKPLKRELSDEEVAELAKTATVIIGNGYLCGHCDKTHVSPASGYIIDESGIVVTNHHVIDNYAAKDTVGKKLTLQIMLSNGESYPVVEVLSNSPERDLAVIRVDTKGKKLPAFRLGEDAKQGADIFVMSHPQQMYYYFSKGIVARNYLRNVGRRNTDQKYPEMEVTADYAAGSSGAPVLDNKGNVVGTVSTTNSIYYNPQKQESLQMVVKGTKPVASLRELLVMP